MPPGSAISLQLRSYCRLPLSYLRESDHFGSALHCIRTPTAVDKLNQTLVRNLTKLEGGAVESPLDLPQNETRLKIKEAA